MRYVALQHDMFHFVQHDIYSLCSYSIWYKFHNIPKGTYRATGISYPQGYIANSVRNLYRFGKNYLKTPIPTSDAILSSFGGNRAPFPVALRQGCNPALLVWTRPMVVDFVFDDIWDNLGLSLKSSVNAYAFKDIHLSPSLTVTNIPTLSRRFFRHIL